MNLLESNATETQRRCDRLSHLSVCVVHLHTSLPPSPPLLPVGSRPAVRSAVSHGRGRPGGGRARAGDVNQPRVRGFLVGRRVIRAGLAGARARGGRARSFLVPLPPSLPWWRCQWRRRRFSQQRSSRDHRWEQVRRRRCRPIPRTRRRFHFSALSLSSLHLDCFGLEK